MILSRKNIDKTELLLESEWIENISLLLAETYKDQLHNLRHFSVNGFSYENELLLMISLLNIKNPELLPTTLSISADLEKSTEVKALLDIIVDHVGFFFDQFFAEKDWDDYVPHWQELSHKNHVLFYKVTRENVELTLKANQLLKDN